MSKVFVLRSHPIMDACSQWLIENYQKAIDSGKPLQVDIGPETKPRTLDQQALMWVGPLANIAEQATEDGQKYRSEMWHIYYKEMLLPDPAEFDFDPSHVKKGYLKWDYPPKGKDRVLVGSTKDLTTKGMGVYLERMMAHAATVHHVVFTEPEP